MITTIVEPPVDRITRRVSVQQKSSSYVSFYGTPDRWQKRKTDLPETHSNLIQLKYALL